MPVGTQGEAAPPGAEDRTEGPWRDTDPSTFDLETPLAVPPSADPPDSPPFAQEAAGQPDLTSLSLDELLSLNISGDLTDLETAADEEESGAVGRSGPLVDDGAARGDFGSTGPPESDGPSPLEDQGGALIQDPYPGPYPGPYLGPYFGPDLGGNLLGSPMGDDLQVYLDHLV